jgi:hypothetical protein
MEFSKFPCSQNKDSPMYYEINFDNFCYGKTDEALALMRGTQIGMRTMLMSVHIVNKDTREKISSIIPDHHVLKQLNQAQ